MNPQQPNQQPMPTPEQGQSSAAPENLTPAPLPAAGEAAPSAPAAIPAMPVLPQTADPAVPAGTPPPTGSGPVVADDVDVIEKEWVDQAEKVVKQTAGDPYQEEEAVEALQVDYLKKRYGKEVKKSEGTNG